MSYDVVEVTIGKDGKRKERVTRYAEAGDFDGDFDDDAECSEATDD